jgi:hypothetical protein
MSRDQFKGGPNPGTDRRFILTLRPTPQCADPIKALRALLKAALRRHGLRAIACEETHHDPRGPQCRK